MDKKLNIATTPLKGLFVIMPNSLTDVRGIFSRVFCQDELKDIGIMDIKQINHSYTKNKGTVRGLHFQYEPNAETRIIKCLKGSIFDVVVDIRKNSSTFLQTFYINITDKNQKMIYIPKGFAHGFQTLEDNTELLYLHNNIYKPSNEGALNIKDDALNINFPLEVVNLSNRDKNHKYIDSSFRGITVNEL